MHRYLVKWTSEHTSLSTRAARYAVASLIAAAPNDAPASPAGPVTGSLGTSLGLAVRGGNMKAGSAEATLHLLTRQQRTTVTRSLPALARQIQRAGVAIDWGQLADDLARWDRDRDRVATRWLEHYYRASDVPDEAGSDHTTDDPDAGTDAGSDK